MGKRPLPGTAAAASKPVKVTRKTAAKVEFQFGEGEWTTTSIHLPGPLWDMLVDASIRAQRQRRRQGEMPGRASVSEVLRDILIRHEDEIRSLYTD